MAGNTVPIIHSDEGESEEKNPEIKVEVDADPKRITDSEEYDPEMEKVDIKEEAVDETIPQAGFCSCDFDGLAEICEDDYPAVSLDGTDEDDDDAPILTPSTSRKRRRSSTGRSRWVTPKEKRPIADDAESGGTMTSLSGNHPGRKRIKIADADCYEAYVLQALDHSAKASKEPRATQKTESGKKPHDCHLCEYKTFKSKKLKLHMRTHTGEKPYTCNICGHEFAQSTNLKTHMRIHTNEKPYACDYCSYTCAQGNNMKRHMRIHTGEKHFECIVCGYKCIQVADLKRHVMIHTGEKPYACDQCDYTSIQASTLKLHKKNHHEKPYT